MKGGKEKARCQCDPKCKVEPLAGSPFCKDHEHSCPRVAQLSGAELPYNPDLYNKNSNIKAKNNCYAYAFQQDIDGKTLPNNYPQPGLASGYPSWSKIKGKRCPDLVSRFMGDVPGIKPSTFEEKCPAGMRKISAVVDANEDYHFYAQHQKEEDNSTENSNTYAKKYGMWAHKPGGTDVTNLDASGRPIYDPQLASKDYDTGLDYDSFCGYYCIPTGKEIKLSNGGGRKAKTRKAKAKKTKARQSRKTKARKSKKDKI
jgi:hypothetical protein